MDKKISQLTAATTPLTGAEELAIVQSGVTKKTTIEDVKGYKVYTALLTQSGGSVLDQLDETTPTQNVTKGVTYTIANASDGDFLNVGAPNNNTGTSFVAINNSVPTSWGQSGASLIFDTGAPVVTVLENTIGNIWFTYNNTGEYYVNSNSLFTINKSLAFIGDLSDVGPNAGLAGIIFSTPNFFNITSVSNFISSDGMLDRTPIEIRVYN